MMLSMLQPKITGMSPEGVIMLKEDVKKIWEQNAEVYDERKKNNCQMK